MIGTGKNSVPELETETAQAPLSDGLIPYEGSISVCVPASKRDMPLVNAILHESPMEGWVRIIFAKGEGFVSGESAQKQRIILVKPKKRPHECAAIFAMQSYAVFYDGKAEQAVYLSLLRLRPAFRGRVSYLKDGYASIPHFVKQLGWPERYFTSIAEDNAPAQRLLKSGLSFLPRYSSLGRLTTMVFSTALGKQYGLLQRAAREDGEEIAIFFKTMNKNVQYAPVLTFAAKKALGEETQSGPDGSPIIPENFYVIRQNGAIAACLAVWNRQREQQVIIDGYRHPLRLARPFYNIWARLRKLPCLPAPGSIFGGVFIAYAAFAPSALPLAAQAVREALYYARREHGAASAMLGLSEDSALAPYLAALPRTAYATCIEDVSWDKKTPPTRNANPVQPEIALL